MGSVKLILLFAGLRMNSLLVHAHSIRTLWIKIENELIQLGNEYACRLNLIKYLFQTLVY